MPKGSAANGTIPPSKSAAETRRIMAKLGTQHPNADTELRFANAFELLVATILSAQCTDERVNQVTPALFRRYPNARALAAATAGELEPQIQSTGFFRAKSRSLLGMAQACMERHHGDVPRTMAELVELPGVGRKTANVVLGHALGVPGLPVDRHVLRVANRIGIARSDDPEVVERQLCAAMPPAQWTLTSDTLILHGRRICKPRPLCEQCVVREKCDYYRALLSSRAASGPSVEEPRAAKRRGTGRGGGPPSPGESDQARLRRAGPKPHEGRAPRSSRTESGSSVEEPRAAKRRGTGHGGGAPRQGKK